MCFQLVQLHALNRTGAKSWLVQIYPAAEIGRHVNLTSGPVTLGRDDQSSVTLDDVAVSRHHAKIEQVGDQYVVTDLGSRNGTYVNDVARCAPDAGQWRPVAAGPPDSQIRRGRPVRGAVLRDWSTR